MKRVSSLVCGGALVAYALALPASALAEGPRTGVLLAAKGKKAAEEEAKKKAEEEAAAKKAADEEAAKKAAEEEAKKKAEEEAAAKKAAEEEAAKKAAADEEAATKPAKKAAKDEDDAEASSGDEVRFDDLGFKEKYFSFGLPETASKQVQDEKMKFILLSIVAAMLLPVPEIWLPLVMWDPKPEMDLGRMIVPWIIKHAVWVGGHVAMSACWIVPYAGWVCGALLLPVQIAWYVVNIWTSRIMMLMIYDDIIKHPPEKKSADK